ncbi:MAG: WbqC family protein [Flavobacteriales bacterium]|nr:WbqC family protein [Flavobacteriales bacterium]
MQPYLFPYIGYFQLIHATDRFVVLDDVNYIKKGWVNRNNILERASAALFTVPLVGASQNRRINEIEISVTDKWQEKLLRRIHHAYGKAPHYEVVLPIIERVLVRTDLNLAAFNVAALREVMSYLELQTQIVESSVVDPGRARAGQERLLHICAELGAGRYINPIGGVELYDREIFAKRGVQLNFLRSHMPEYRQSVDKFVPGLSIIDVLMFNSIADIRQMLDRYDLI